MKLTKPFMSKKIIGYCRVSTDNQKDEGTIDIQRQALKAYADANGYELVKLLRTRELAGGLRTERDLPRCLVI